MIQSHFFLSSLKEIQLNIRDIYSLQGELKQSIVNKTKKITRLDSEIPKEIERFPTPTTTTFTVAKETSIPVSFPTQIEIATNPTAKEEQSNYQDVLNQTQPPNYTSITSTSDSRFKPAQNTRKIHIKNSNESAKKIKLEILTIPFLVVFLICEITALLVLIFFVL